MSYCRWSSDNFECDLYCYSDVNGGYTTHVAGRRRQGDELVAIGLPHDGKTFNDATLEEFKERLLSLRAAGYSFPNYVLETVDAEIAEEAESTP